MSEEYSLKDQQEDPRTDFIKSVFAYNLEAHLKQSTKPKTVGSLEIFDKNDGLLPESLPVTKATLNDSPCNRPPDSSPSIERDYSTEKFINPYQNYAGFSQYYSVKQHSGRRCETSFDETEDSMMVDSGKRRLLPTGGKSAKTANNQLSNSFVDSSRSLKRNLTSGTLTNKNKNNLNYSVIEGHSMKRSSSNLNKSYNSGRKRPSPSPNTSMRIPDFQPRKILEERKQITEHFRQQGKQKYENKVLRQELERQMKMLANRVRRLQEEEGNIKKNIKKTEDITKKAIVAKQRYQEDLQNSESAKLKKIETEEINRQKIKEEKMKRTENMKNSILSLHQKRLVNAAQVKGVKQEENKKKIEILRKEEEKKLKIRQDTLEFEKTLKCKKTVNRYVNKDFMNENHLKFLQEEHMKTLDIENKIKELAQVEEHLIDKIKHTHQLQIQAENTMKRVLSTKVEKRKLLEFNQPKFI